MQEEKNIPDDSEEIELNSSFDLSNLDEIANIVQALIFACSDVVTVKKIKDVLGDFITPQLMREVIDISNEKLGSINSPFEIVAQANGYRFRTKKDYFGFVRKLFPESNLTKRLSRASLETIAIVAYKQPVTKAEIEAIRGVQSCDAPLKLLLEKGLVALSNRSNAIGNAFQYVTTNEFLKYFGITNITEDLPKLHELEDIIQSDALLPELNPNKNETFMDDIDDPNQLQLSIDE